jgi:hypothetical protein
VLAAPFIESALRRRQSSAAVIAWASAQRIGTGRFNLQRTQGMMCVLSFAALDAQGLYAEPSHSVCSISGDRQYPTCSCPCPLTRVLA